MRRAHAAFALVGILLIASQSAAGRPAPPPTGDFWRPLHDCDDDWGGAEGSWNGHDLIALDVQQLRGPRANDLVLRLTLQGGFSTLNSAPAVWDEFRFDAAGEPVVSWIRAVPKVNTAPGAQPPEQQFSKGSADTPADWLHGPVRVHVGNDPAAGFDGNRSTVSLGFSVQNLGLSAGDRLGNFSVRGWTGSEPTTAADFLAGGVGGSPCPIPNDPTFVRNATPFVVAPHDMLPTAAFHVASQDLDDQHPVNFTDQSSDDHGISAWLWNFGELAQSADQSPNFTFPPGTHKVTLTATDTSGQTDRIEKYVMVAEGPNRAPSAGFTAAVDNFTLRFDATPSSDPDGDALQFFWKLGDGQQGVGRFINHTYKFRGPYDVELTAFDGELQTTIKRTITISAGGNSPLVDFTYSPENPLEGQRVDFTAVASDDGHIDEYNWQVGNLPGSGTSAYRWFPPGHHVVRLTVVDNEGLSASVAKTISVGAKTLGPQPAGTPSPSATPSPTPRAEPVVPQFHLVPAKPVTDEWISFLDRSSGGLYQAHWNWSFGDGNFSNIRQPDYRYERPGEYTVTQSIYFDDGRRFFSSKEVTIGARDDETGGDDRGFGIPGPGVALLVTVGLASAKWRRRN